MSDKRESPKKPPVVAFNRGVSTEYIITQDHLRELEGAQRTEWVASKRAALLSEQIKSALAHGASIENGPLYFDDELEMVRSKKEIAQVSPKGPHRSERSGKQKAGGE